MSSVRRPEVHKLVWDENDFFLEDQQFQKSLLLLLEMEIGLSLSHEENNIRTFSMMIPHREM